MEPPLLTLVYVVFGFLISFYALQVESQPDSPHGQSSTQPPPSPPPPRSPPLSPSPPRPLMSPPPPSPSLRSPPPPSPSLRSPPPPSPPAPPPPRSSLYRNTHRPTQTPAPNKSKRPRPPPMEKSAAPPPAPPSGHENRINAGKKIGLLFTGIAAILQIGVISFLVFKRRQILRVNDRYESCS